MKGEEFRVQGAGFRVEELRLRGTSSCGSGFRDLDVLCIVYGPGFRVKGAGCMVEGWGLWIYCPLF